MPRGTHRARAPLGGRAVPPRERARAFASGSFSPWDPQRASHSPQAPPWDGPVRGGEAPGLPWARLSLVASPLVPVDPRVALSQKGGRRIKRSSTVPRRTDHAPRRRHSRSQGVVGDTLGRSWAFFVVRGVLCLPYYAPTYELPGVLWKRTTRSLP